MQQMGSQLNELSTSWVSKRIQYSSSMTDYFSKLLLFLWLWLIYLYGCSCHFTLATIVIFLLIQWQKQHMTIQQMIYLQRISYIVQK